MSLYEALLQELKGARRKMVAHYGKPDHNVYRQMVHFIEDEIKALTVIETVSA